MMAISLKDIHVGKEARPPRLFIYGTDGVGKSTWAADAPNPIFTPTEDRLAHINVAKFPLCESYDETLETVHLLLKEDHEYQTHVTDSVDWFEKLIHKKIMDDTGEKTITSNTKGSELSFGRGWQLAATYFRQYLQLLERLWKEKNMQIILIGHAEIKRFEDPMRDSYDKYWPNCHERVRDAAQQWVDCVLFANHVTSVKSEESGFGKTKKRAVGSGARILYTEERPAFEAKNSYNLPPELPLPQENPYSTFAEAYSKWLEA